MRIVLALVLTTIAIHSTTARCRRPRVNPLMGALQNILSPANAEKTMQMLKMATQNTLNNVIGPCNPTPVQYSPSILPIPEPCNYPLNQQRTVLPNPNSLMLPNSISCQMPVQVPPGPLQIPGPTPMPSPIPVPFQLPSPPIQLPAPVQLSCQAPVQLPNPFPIQLPCQSSIQMPTTIQLPLPNPPLPCQMPQLPCLAPQPEIIIERPSCGCQREIVYPSAEPSCLCNSIIPIPEVNVPIAMTANQEIYSCPIPSPAALFTMPAASPGSGWTQENMPCGNTGTRSQYLRKIPIPPPTL